MSTDFDSQRRYGRFHLASEFVLRADPTVLQIMGLCSIFQAEARLMNDVVEYLAACALFRPVELGEMIPEYTWIIRADGFIACEEVPRDHQAFLGARLPRRSSMPVEQLDRHLDAILKAAGSSLRHYTMQKSKEDMRAALRSAIDEGGAQ